MKQEKIGLFYAISAFLFWGLCPIYYKQISMIPPFEILAHRVVFSVFVLIILLSISKQFITLKPILKSFAKMKYLIFASILISINWFTFIYAISIDKIVEASLGYFITPLVNVALGFLFFSERVNKLQGFSILLALFSVIYELLTLGSIPIIALVLAFSFGFYGMLRKRVQIASIPGLFIETIIMLPIALFYLFYLVDNNQSYFNTLDNYNLFILSLSGLVTVLPLLWFNSAATRMSLTTLGFLQYLGPTVAFIIAITLYNEELSINKLFTFILIWIALVLFSFGRLNKKEKN
ncbi:protein RarD [Malaciobacter mytili LMG 24559]|uniref:Protein RarD n=1 Tax=Malaciobacter mytili LMG 24559 TaxID=1032238 RepID=A0AAX2AIL8_9BACT|nr:EamA family transporter RarD [Malaciobacter mytili]AXH16038.1 resistance permease RarD [Malaciobacter mytili LMG 24559]RXK15778.1 protein RarD [Malaciobacter mytili LMG 24559]